MTYKDLEAFEAEREQARKMLGQLGRDTGVADTSTRDLSKIQHDFDLPYSTLPKLRRIRRISTPSLAR